MDVFVLIATQVFHVQANGLLKLQCVSGLIDYLAETFLCSSGKHIVGVIHIDQEDGRRNGVSMNNIRQQLSQMDAVSGGIALVPWRSMGIRM